MAIWQIADLTDKNLHTEAVFEVVVYSLQFFTEAQEDEKNKLIADIQILKMQHKDLRYMTEGMLKRRKDILSRAMAVIPEKKRESIRRSL